MHNSIYLETKKFIDSNDEFREDDKNFAFYIDNSDRDKQQNYYENNIN